MEFNIYDIFGLKRGTLYRIHMQIFMPESSCSLIASEQIALDN